MRVWYFSEMAYHPAWEEGLKRGSLRVVLPNSNYDPQIGHRLLNRYLDEFALCDEVGLDIVANEHHSTATCLTVSVSAPTALAIIAHFPELHRHAARHVVFGDRGEIGHRRAGRAVGLHADAVSIGAAAPPALPFV